MRKMVIIGIVTAAASFALLSLHPAQAQTPTYQTAAWTFMVYMDADNNLEAFGITDFMELSRIGSTDQVNIVVQFDRIPGYSTAYGNWTDTRRFLITQGMTPDAVNGKSIGEVNMGNPQTLINFVQWAKTTYPAQHYALVLWDHGSGWRVQVVDTEARKGIAYDDSSSGDGLNAPELRNAYHAITAGGSEPLDLVGFDACLMGMIEVDGQLIPYAQVRVGSQDTEPGPGWPYDTILSDLTANPGMSAAQLGSAIVNRYHAAYGSETMSAVSLDASYTTLNTAVDTFALALINMGGPYNTAISSARSNTQYFYNSDYIDLYDFASRVSHSVSEPAIRTAAAQVMTAITSTVIAERHGIYWPGAHGISVYFPTSKARFDRAYNGTSNWLQFTKDTNWDEWLKRYFTTPSLPAPPLFEPMHGTLTGDGRPIFRWNALEGANRYRIQVDNDADFSSPVISTGRSTTSMRPLTALGSKPYYWRVQARDVNGNWSAWSPAWVVTVDRIKPLKSILQVPVYGTTMPSNMPVFEWANPSPDVAYYQLQIDNTSLFSSPDVNVTVFDSRYVPSPGLSGSKYFWRVRAYDLVGNRGPWSATWKIVVNLSPAIVPVAVEAVSLPVEPTVTPVTPVEQPRVLQTVEAESAHTRQDGLWTTHDTPSASGGGYIYNSGAASDVLTLRFYGSQLELVYVRHPALGMLAIEVDEVLIQALNSRATEAEFGARAAYALPDGEHTLRVYALSGTIAVDAFAVEFPLEPPVAPTETAVPAIEPIIEPTIEPSTEPTIEPTVEAPVETPIEPTIEPTIEATTEPTIEPTIEPTVEPTIELTVEPSVEPTVEVTLAPGTPAPLPPEPAAEQPAA